MKNSLILIRELKQIRDEESFKLLLKRYLDEEYSVKNLLENIIDNQKRKIIFDILFSKPLFNSEEIIKNNYDYLSNDDKVYIFRLVLKNSPLQAYFFLKEIEDSKKYLTNEEILNVLSSVPTDIVINDFNSYFQEELLKKDDYYKLLSIKKDLKNDTIKNIYGKSFRLKKGYLSVVTYLSDEEKKDYTKMFLDLGVTNYEIAIDLINNKYYNDNCYDGLLKVIENYAPSSIIYDVLMKEKLSEKQQKSLEKALLKTCDIEYISYYYFYKNKEKFIELFGSTLLFLSFVMLNKRKFKNDDILQDVILKIKEANAIYADDVINKVKKAYVKNNQIK